MLEFVNELNRSVERDDRNAERQDCPERRRRPTTEDERGPADTRGEREVGPIPDPARAMKIGEGGYDEADLGIDLFARREARGEGHAALRGA